MKMVNDKRDMRPLILKLGVALALSFAGFLYSNLRTRRIRPPSSPPMQPPSSGDGKFFDVGGKEGLEDELSSVKTTPSSIDTASIAAENYEEESHHQATNDNPVVGLSPSSKHSGDEEGFLLPEFNELVLKEFELPATNTGVSPRKDVEMPMTLKRTADKEMEQEIKKLRNMVRVLREREMILEIQLLEYYGLKEQEKAVVEIQNRLKINAMEAKLFTLKIDSLQADNERLEARVADYSRVMADLESARVNIKLLKRKIRSDAEQYKEQFSALHQRVATLQDEEHWAARNDADVQKKLQRFKELEDESAELRRANSRLQCENSELMRRPESTQSLGASVLEVPEAEALQEANHRLRQENDDLLKETESLQANRCADAEELVYLRWVNACLRYELRNHEAPPGRTVARDLSKTLSPRSEEKAKQLILEYANSEVMGDRGVSLMDFDSGYWSSSQDSNITESGEFDDSSIDISSATRTNSSTKSKFFSKLKRLVLGKDGHKNIQFSSVDKIPRSYAASGRRESVSAGSFEDMVGTYSCSTFSPHQNLSISATVLTGVEARTDEQKNKITPSSRSSSSLDTQRLRKLSVEDIGDVESNQRNSEVGSSNGYKRMVRREDGVIGLPQDNQLEQDPDAFEKLELMKFAEVLKGSNGTTKSRRRSASHCSY